MCTLTHDRLRVGHLTMHSHCGALFQRFTQSQGVEALEEIKAKLMAQIAALEAEKNEISTSLDASGTMIGELYS